ncbi:MAG TPA: methylamine utilization protein [Noviherbaspirillum sp.]|uniref:methylamine utilization protein n=1 Tax=Noviherbaspirillum sp. TaxID=1926288 RepID=UPI002DDD3769|nr:methylamine utilization protein [Noviherbaspirillum sp.]HEV2610923.1 methylamine utilization protein [Noviherbaspirillum sp.]
MFTTPELTGVARSQQIAPNKRIFRVCSAGEIVWKRLMIKSFKNFPHDNYCVEHPRAGFVPAYPFTGFAARCAQGITTRRTASNTVSRTCKEDNLMRLSSIHFVAATLQLCGLSASAAAADLTIDVKDSAGAPVIDTVIYAEPLSGPVAASKRSTVVIEQKGRKFLPLVSVVQAGTDISFPNNDSVRHHVYSFSPAKSFELQLYSGVPGTPVHFDKPGTIVVGCNIHDKMITYIHVVATPYFGKTDNGGKIVLSGLPAGKYRIKAWHYGLPQTAPLPEQLVTLSSTDEIIAFKVNVKAGSASQ